MKIRKTTTLLSTHDPDVDVSSDNSVEKRNIGILGFPIVSETNPSIAERQTTPTNLGGIASLLFVMAAPVLYPLIAKASERSDNDPYISWRREDTVERLFGPFQRGLGLINKRMKTGSKRLGTAVRRVGKTSVELPGMIRNTARLARTRNFNTIKRMGAATSNFMDNMADNVQKSRVRNYKNIARMGSALSNFAARAARRIG